MPWASAASATGRKRSRLSAMEQLMFGARLRGGAEDRDLLDAGCYRLLGVSSVLGTSTEQQHQAPLDSGQYFGRVGHLRVPLGDTKAPLGSAGSRYRTAGRSTRP